MKLTSMKMSAEEKKAMSPQAAGLPEADKQEYPYGLRLELSDEALKKLGVTLPKAGETLMLAAKVTVEHVNMSDSAGGGKHQHCSLQITDLALEGSEPKRKPAGDVFYGDKA